MKEWYVTCKAFTCWIKTHDGIIIASAPIANRWIGQSFSKFLDYYKAEKVLLEI